MINFILYLIFLPHINNLKSESFFERDYSEKVLNEYSWITFRFLDKEFNDLEQNHRAKRIVEKELKLNRCSCIVALLNKKRPDSLVRISLDGYEKEYVIVPKWVTLFYDKRVIDTIGNEKVVERTALINTSKKMTKILRHYYVPRIFVEKLQDYMIEREKKIFN